MAEELARRLLCERLGVRKRSTVFVHSSAAHLDTEFPFYRILTLLREAVGPEGTLVFPSWHYQGRAEDYLRRPDAVFDVKRSPTTMGIIAEFARRLDGARRSLHPTSSVVAVGPQAEVLVKDHAAFPLWPCGPESPFYRIVDSGGIIVGLGVTAHNLSFVHCVEDEMKEAFPVEVRRPEPMLGRVHDAEKHEHVIPTLVHHPRIRWREIEGYLGRHVSAAAFESFTVDGVPFFRADAARLLDEMRALAEAGTTIYWRAIYREAITSRWIR